MQFSTETEWSGMFCSGSFEVETVEGTRLREDGSALPLSSAIVAQLLNFQMEAMIDLRLHKLSIENLAKF